MKRKNPYGLRKAIREDSMTLDQIQMFIHKWQLAVEVNSLYFTFKKTKDLRSILKILYHVSAIAGYTISTENENIYKIMLSYDIKGMCSIRKINQVSKVRQRITINILDMRRYMHEYGWTGTGIVRTKRGIISIQECLKYHVGGEFLAYIV
jgi:ribosomal protein S8